MAQQTGIPPIDNDEDTTAILRVLDEKDKIIVSLKEASTQRDKLNEYQIRVLSGDNEKKQQRISTLSEKLGDTEKKLLAHSSELDVYKERYKQLSMKLDELSTALTGYKDQVGHSLTQIGDMVSLELTRRDEQTGVLRDRLTDNVRQLEERLAAVDAQYRTMLGEINQKQDQAKLFIRKALQDLQEALGLLDMGSARLQVDAKVFDEFAGIVQDSATALGELGNRTREASTIVRNIENVHLTLSSTPKLDNFFKEISNITSGRPAGREGAPGPQPPSEQTNFDDELESLLEANYQESPPPTQPPPAARPTGPARPGPGPAGQTGAVGRSTPGPQAPAMPPGTPTASAGAPFFDPSGGPGVSGPLSAGPSDFIPSGGPGASGPLSAGPAIFGPSGGPGVSGPLSAGPVMFGPSGGPGVSGPLSAGPAIFGPSGGPGASGPLSTGTPGGMSPPISGFPGGPEVPQTWMSPGGGIGYQPAVSGSYPPAWQPQPGTAPLGAPGGLGYGGYGSPSGGRATATMPPPPGSGRFSPEDGATINTVPQGEQSIRADDDLVMREAPSLAPYNWDMLPATSPLLRFRRMLNNAKLAERRENFTKAMVVYRTVMEQKTIQDDPLARSILEDQIEAVNRLARSQISDNRKRHKVRKNLELEREDGQ